jgi:hypothetical protein
MCRVMLGDFSYLNPRNMRVEINGFKVNMLKLGETTMIRCMKIILKIKMTFISSVHA